MQPVAPRIGGAKEWAHLWVPICIGHLEQVPCVPEGVFLQQDCQDQGKLLWEAPREHSSAMEKRGRSEAQGQPATEHTGTQV